MCEEKEPTTIEEWLETRPDSVKKLHAEFPFGSTFQGPNGEHLYLLGYTEDDKLILSEANPGKDFEKARATQKFICASHYRGDPDARH